MPEPADPGAFKAFGNFLKLKQLIITKPKKTFAKTSKSP
jgi:hypothetical protein